MSDDPNPEAQSCSHGLSRRWHLAVGGVFLCLTAGLYGYLFAEPLDSDDFEWISGKQFGTQHRWTQHLLLHWIWRPLFGDWLPAYRLLCLALHAVNGWLVYRLFLAWCLGVRASIADTRGAVTAGALLAGFFFLWYHCSAPTWIAALAYQLVVCCSLLALLAMLRFLERGRLIDWLPVALAVVLALLSHAYALSLPGLLVVVELCWRRARGEPWTLRSAAQRYVPLLALLVLQILLVWDALGRYLDRGQAAVSPGAFLLSFPEFLRRTFELLEGATIALSYDPVGGAQAVELGLLLLVGILGVRQLLRVGGRPGLLGVITLFFLLWNAAIYPQFVAASRLQHFCDHRNLFGAAGVAITMAYLFVSGYALASRWAHSPRSRWVAGILCLVVSPLVCLGPPHFDELTRVHRTWQLLRGERSPQSWFFQHRFPCPTLTAILPAAVTQQLAGDRQLACRRLARWALPPRTDLRRADLRGALLYEARLRGVDLREASLAGAYAVWADLRWAALQGANLERANLSGARLDDAQLQGSHLAGARLRGVTLARARLEGADLAGGDLRNARMAWAVLRRADLTGIDGVGVDLNHADLRQADLAGATLIDANLIQADFSGANLTGTDLTGAILDGAKLDGVDLSVTIRNGAGPRPPRP